MKRIVTLLLAIVFAVSFLLTGCSQIENLVKGAGAYSLVKGAVEKTNELDSADVKVTVNMKMQMAGMSLDVPIVMEMKMSGLKGNAPIGTAKMKTETFMGSTEQTLYFDKDYLYVEQDESKFKVSRGSEDADNYKIVDFKDLVKDLPEDALKDVKVEEKDDGSKSVSVDISKTVFDKLFRMRTSNWISTIPTWILPC